MVVYYFPCRSEQLRLLQLLSNLRDEAGSAIDEDEKEKWLQWTRYLLNLEARVTSTPASMMVGYQVRELSRVE